MPSSMSAMSSSVGLMRSSMLKMQSSMSTMTDTLDTNAAAMVVSQSNALFLQGSATASNLHLLSGDGTASNLALWSSGDDLVLGHAGILRVNATRVRLSGSFAPAAGGTFDLGTIFGGLNTSRC
jgi:hypothetical protein